MEECIWTNRGNVLTFVEMAGINSRTYAMMVTWETEMDAAQFACKRLTSTAEEVILEVKTLATGSLPLSKMSLLPLKTI